MKRNLENDITETVLKHGSRKVADLAVEFGVSEVTIRKNLDILERRGVIRRFHGEARAYDGDAIPFRMGMNYAAKMQIARLAAEHVEPGDTLMLEAGSTVAIMAELIKDQRDLTIITPNLFIARIFRGGKNRVIVLGGLYQEESESMVGPLTRNAISEIAFSKSFIGVTGYTSQTGFTLNDYNRAEITQAILDRGGQNFILTDSSKFGASHVAPLGKMDNRIHTVITDSHLSDTYRAELSSHGITVIC